MAKRGTLDHPKTLMLADALDCDEADALGLLESLWHVTAKYYHTGKLKDVTPRSLCRSLRTRRDPQAVWDALVSCKWIDLDGDGCAYIHDWHDHADDTTRKNLKNRSECFELADGTLLQPYEKISRTIRESCANDLRQPEPEPEPEPKPIKEIIPAEKSDTPKPRFSKPSMQECELYAQEVDMPLSEGTKFFDFYESKGWKVGSSPMKDWHAAMRNWRSRWKDSPSPTQSQNGRSGLNVMDTRRMLGDLIGVPVRDGE